MCVYSPVITLCRCASRGITDSIVSAFFGRNNKPEKRGGVETCDRSTHRIECEEVDPGARAEGHQGGAAIEGVAGAHDVIALLQGIFLGGLPL